MENRAQMIMWTAQQRRVWEQLQDQGVYYVQKKYVTEKYEEVSWVFQEAYSYMGNTGMKELSKPTEAQSPVWLFGERSWLAKEADTVVLQLEIPVDELVLFDMRGWSKVLNLSYVGTAEEEEQFARKLEKNGISDPLDLFRKPFYPLPKREVISSWERIFDLDETAKEYIQGAAWGLKASWVKAIDL